MKPFRILLIILLLPLSADALEFVSQRVDAPAAAAKLSSASKINGLPDGIITRGNKNIREAWLTGPTRRYSHGILGDAIEAAGLSVITSENQ